VAKCAATLDRIAEVEHKKPTDVDTTLSAIVGLWEFLQTNKDASQSENNEHLKNAWNDSQDLRQRLQAEMNLPQLRKQYREARKELRDLADHLFEVASRANGRAVQSMASGSTLLLCDDFADSVNQSFADDRLQLTNHTGRTLHRCILLVSCEGGNRQLAHFHYKDAWPSDRTFFTAYHVGNDSYDYPNALDGTRQIRVKLVSSELQVEEVFPYTDSARNRHLQDSLANFHFSMGYLPYQKFFGFENHCGASFSFSGPSRLVPSKITLSMINTKMTPPARQSATAEGSAWNSGEEQSIRDPRFDNFDADTFVLELEFPLTSYRPRYTWTRTAKE
jgi:hypothetical protein